MLHNKLEEKRHRAETDRQTGADNGKSEESAIGEVWIGHEIIS